jgi:ABC-2 type transport system permease protein
MRLLTLLRVFVRRDAAIQVSYRFDLLLQLAAMAFTLALFFYLSELIDESSFGEKSGVAGGYFDFVVLGLALIRVVQSGITAYATRIRQDQITGTLEALFATPTSPSLLILFSAAFDLARAVVQSAMLVALAALLFGFDADPGVIDLIVALAAFVGCVLFFAALGVVVAAFTIVFKQTTALVSLAVSALGLLGGAYFPSTVLPGPLQPVSDALPFSWALDVMRSALLSGDPDLELLALEWGICLLLVPVSLYVFNRALRRARRDGSLAQY